MTSLRGLDVPMQGSRRMHRRFDVVLNWPDRSSFRNLESSDITMQADMIDRSCVVFSPPLRPADPPADLPRFAQP